jgi:hypothetical protein
VLSGNLVRIDHRYPTFYQRDYKGTQGGLNYFWSISDKTWINFSINRTNNSWYDFASSYYVMDTASVSPTWQISARTKMHILMTRSKADFRGPILPNRVARHDNNQTEELGLDWSPQRSVVLSTSMQSARRSTNNAAYEYDDKTVNLFLQLAF